MRTNIVIDDQLMTQVLKATGIKTKRDAVEAGLRLLLQVKAQEGMRSLRGKVPWEGDLEAMRTGRFLGDGENGQ
jgi:Arc/MetJ family transcription regulator